MDTARIDICYRPLRIAWAIRSDDKAGFRHAVRLTHTLWGGRFNPIVMADRADEARKIVDLFRADMIVPIGDSAEVKESPAMFPHLINPLFGDTLFARDAHDHPRARILDVHNALVHWRNHPEWKVLEERGLRSFVCTNDDPLADIVLIQAGAYPEDDIGINYEEILTQASTCIQHRIDKALPLPVDLLQRPSLGYLTRLGINRHFSVSPGWDYPGYYVGDAANLDDLVVFWNLRAADIGLQFFDPGQVDRYTFIRSEYEQQTLARLARFDKHRRNLSVWSRIEPAEAVLKHFEGQRLTVCHIDPQFFWNGRGIRPPTMMLGDASSLGVFNQSSDKPRVSFALGDKPFSEDVLVSYATFGRIGTAVGRR